MRWRPPQSILPPLLQRFMYNAVYAILLVFFTLHLLKNRSMVIFTFYASIAQMIGAAIMCFIQIHLRFILLAFGDTAGSSSDWDGQGLIENRHHEIL